MKLKFELSQEGQMETTITLVEVERQALTKALLNCANPGAETFNGEESDSLVKLLRNLERIKMNNDF